MAFPNDLLESAELKQPLILKCEIQTQGRREWYKSGAARLFVATNDGCSDVPMVLNQQAANQVAAILNGSFVGKPGIYGVARFRAAPETPGSTEYVVRSQPIFTPGWHQLPRRGKITDNLAACAIAAMHNIQRNS